MSNMAIKPKKYRAALLLAVAWVMLISFAFINSTAIAKWSSARAGGDSVSVALFAVDATAITAGNLSIDCGADVNVASYQFVVTNQKDGNTSQVAVGYDVKVVLPSELPEGVTMVVDGIAGAKAEDGLTYTFSSDDWSFAAGVDGSKIHTLVFAADPDAFDVDVSISAINISVVAEQLN